ncbi:porin [Schleiferia thermophila str. Yellowstone]|jgi:hypothetical protein|uniref:hypothetical protein n=1 Tax=Schleiferia thermophila TaxID=884107 RepID=UPI0004E67E66|nr:hypothetical protein [Schleiferia thermophila]KFD40028.1 porin [Schleiferia thermophila str. Yellowstone]
MKVFRILLHIILIFSYKGYAQGSKWKKLVDTLTYETQTGLPIAASKIYFSESRFTISGYGESNFIRYLGEKNTLSDDLELYMTNMQRFVTYAAYKPKKWFVLYIELFAEYMNDGVNEKHFEFQPEFFIDFLFSEKFNLRVGTHQVQIGFINNNDEPILFYSVNRPEVERIIIPSTWIDLGIMTYGKINKNLKWSASLYQGLDPTDLRGATWIRRGRANPVRFNFEGFTANSSLKYNGFKNTELVLNGLYSMIGHQNISSSTYLLSSYARREYKNWTFMALGAVGSTDNTAGLFEITRQASMDNQGQVLGKNVYGYYTEIGYDIWPILNGGSKSSKNVRKFLLKGNEVKLPLFIRYERLNTHNRIDESLMNKPVFKSDLTAITIGANFNPRRNIVIKSNYQFRNNKAPLADGTFEGNRFEFGLGFIF